MDSSSIGFWLLFLPCIAFWAWHVLRQHGFERDYHVERPFSGARYPCRMDYSASESKLDCFVGADLSSIYLMPGPKPPASWFWGPRSDVFTQNLRIPWSDIEYRVTTILFVKHLYFWVPARRIGFALPLDVGRQILTEANRRPIP